MKWWHWVRKHQMTVSRVTVPMWDPSARGLLWKCECGKTWAK